MTKWDDRFMEMAGLVASWSRDPSTKVGCVIVNPARQVVSTGFNGFPRGVDDDPARYADRETKYRMILHAEANAVLQAGGDVRGGTAYVTHPPCAQCAAVLIQAGIARIVTREPEPGMAVRFADSFAAAETMLREAGVCWEAAEALEGTIEARNAPPRQPTPGIYQRSPAAIMEKG